MYAVRHCFTLCLDPCEEARLCHVTPMPATRDASKRKCEGSHSIGGNQLTESESVHRAASSEAESRLDDIRRRFDLRRRNVHHKKAFETMASFSSVLEIGMSTRSAAWRSRGRVSIIMTPRRMECR